jgi:N-acetylmuramoyl-L-alanine amidase
MLVKSIIISSLIGMQLYSFDIMIDIGHTPSKSGAISASCAKEYDYNKALGNYLIKHLSQNSTVNISMLTQTEVSFQDRYTSSIGKDLFLSLHHDSVQERYIQRNSFGCPNTNHAAGFSIFISRKNPYFDKSLDYAQRFGEALVKQGLTPSLHHAEKIQGENRELLDRRLGIYIFDDLKVLKNAKSPAILFEAGVIVNPVDEAMVKRDEYKSKVSKAISSAFD